MYSMGDRIRTWMPVSQERRACLKRDLPYVMKDTSEEAVSEMVSRYDVLYQLIYKEILLRWDQEDKVKEERRERQRITQWVQQKIR